VGFITPKNIDEKLGYTITVARFLSQKAQPMDFFELNCSKDQLPRPFHLEVVTFYKILNLKKKSQFLI